MNHRAKCIAVVATAWLALHASLASAQVLNPKIEPGPKAKVDIYGDPLPEGALARLGTIRMRHGAFLSWLEFTSDGKYLASQGGEGVAIWKADTGELVHFFPSDYLPTKKQMPHASFSLSKDGKLIAFAGRQGVHIHEVESGKHIKTIATGEIWFPRFSPDGKRIAVRREVDNKPFQVWDIESGRMLTVGGGENRTMFACFSFSPDGKTLMTAGNFYLTANAPPQSICFWDADNGKLKGQIVLGESNPRAFAASADGKFLAFICEKPDQWEENIVRIFDTEARKEVRQLSVENLKVDRVYSRRTMLAFAPDGKTLYSVGLDDAVIAWDVTTGKELRRLEKTTRYTCSAAVSPDGKTLALGASDPASSAICLIDIPSGKQTSKVMGHEGPIRSATLSIDGNTVVTAGSDGIIGWDAKTAKELYRIDSGFVRGLSENGRHFVTSEINKSRDTYTVRIRELASGKEVRQFTIPINNASSPALHAVSPDGKTASFSDSGKKRGVMLVSLETGKEIRFLSVPDQRVYIFDAQFTADGDKLIIRDNNSKLYFWNLIDGSMQQFQYVLPGGNNQGSMTTALSPDGLYMAVHHRGDAILLLDVGTCRIVRRIEKLPSKVAAFAFSPDSKMLAYGDSTQGSVRLLEVATGRERRGFDGHNWSVESLAFAANGKTLVSTGRDATALIWDLTGQQSKTPPAPKLTAAELKDCWTALAGDDAALAYKSIHRLAAAPADAVPFLQKHLSPVAAVDQKRLTALVADLASDTFKIREAASKELFEIGEAASGHMRQVLAGKITLEQKRRIEVILEKLAKDWDNPTPTQLQKLRALESLELAGTPQALELLKHIAGGAPGARITVDAQGAVLRLTKN